MQTDHAILEQVAQAKTSLERADELIRQYQPFIKAQASRALGRLCTEQDDAFSIGMIAFHEAIRGYSRVRGSFLQYAALVMMFAQVSGLEAGELVHVIADAHIYDRHIPLVEQLLEREPYPAPRLELDPSVRDFYAFRLEHFQLHDYQYHPSLGKIPVAL